MSGVKIMYVSEVFVEKVMTEIRRGWGVDLRRGREPDTSTKRKISKIKGIRDVEKQKQRKTKTAKKRK